MKTLLTPPPFPVLAVLSDRGQAEGYTRNRIINFKLIIPMSATVTANQVTGKAASDLLATIAYDDIVSHMRGSNYIVVDQNETDIHKDHNLQVELGFEGYNIVPYDEVISEGQSKVKLTGSIVDYDIEEILQELHAKHGYNLSQELRKLL